MSAKAELDKAGDALARADGAVTDGFAEHRDSGPMRLLAALSEIGDQPQLRILCGATIAAGIAAGSPRLIRAGARMLAAHELATLAKDLVKQRVDRTRPRSADTTDEKKPRKGRHLGKEITSFPSGHTAGSLAVAQAFAREFPEYRAPALAAAGFVALAQIPRCAHYPSDVGAGAAIGLASEFALAQLLPAEKKADD